MLTSLIRIGDGCGIRIPEALVEQLGLKDTVEVRVDQGRLVIQPERTALGRWEEAVASLVERIDDAASFGEIPDLPRLPRLPRQVI
ncbi:MAG: AbrB/MazE/SpoVT family DNA-binding domain-containing protein [Acidobacteriia bacterium]|nr:AbrB/MazE/SpoVT family DNA-binding domain-containing protein [Terriglobia bacterium]